MSCNRRKPTFADPPVLSANEPKADIPWPRPTDKISLQTLSVARMTPFATKTYQSVDLFSEQLIERWHCTWRKLRAASGEISKFHFTILNGSPFLSPTSLLQIACLSRIELR
jgi:hypothetical protein